MRGSAWTWLPGKKAVLDMAKKKVANKALMIFVVPREQTSQDTGPCELAATGARQCNGRSRSDVGPRAAAIIIGYTDNASGASAGEVEVAGR